MATAAVKPAAQRWRPHKGRWAALGLFVGGSIALGAIADWRDRHAFLINTTASLPDWAFMIRLGALPDRGDYVFFAPPPSALLRRHFGVKPQPFGKIVYGMPGDLVTHAGAVVLINGHPVARMKPLTRFGEPLTPGATGPVPEGCYFAGSPHKDGFDSRYAEIGYVCRKQIVGVGEPIL